MNVLSRIPGWLRVVLVAVGYVVLWVEEARFTEWQLQAAVVTLGYAFLLGTSGHAWNLVERWLDDEEKQRSEDEEVAAEATDGGSPEDVAEPDESIEEASDETDEVTESDRDIGTVIGKCENVLILTFMVVGAYTALAVIFAAKSIVRKDDMQNNSRYYLGGTLTNVTYSVAVGLGLYVLLKLFSVWPIAFLGSP
jgi:Flp pilus assembly protein protease CpaA